MFETVDELSRRRFAHDADEAELKVVKALGKGLLKTISKMGISTIQSYSGAQIFEAVGLEQEPDRPPLRRHRVADRRHRARRARPGDAGPPRARLPARGRGPAAGRRRLRLAPRRREAHVEPRDDRARSSTRSRARVAAPRSTTSTPRWSTTRPRATRRCAGCCASATAGVEPIADRRGRAVDRDRQALRDRRDVARVDLHRGARDARDRDEPPRRPLEHRRGRGGPAPLHPRRQRRPAPLGDQAGRVGALRRDDPLPAQLRPAADQDGPGRQARRGRPAAGPQGRQATSAGCATRRRASA